MVSPFGQRTDSRTIVSLMMMVMMVMMMVMMIYGHWFLDVLVGLS